MAAKKNQVPNELDVFEEYLNTAKDLALKLGHMPSVHDLAQELDIKRSSIRHYFNSDKDLHIDMKERYPEVVKKFFTEDDFAPKALSKERSELLKFKRFFVTSAEAAKPLWRDGAAVNSILKWCEKRNAAPVLLPLGRDLLKLDAGLKDFFVVTEDLNLNSNIKLISILTSVTSTTPSSGLAKTAGQSSCSTIFGSTKLSKEAIPTDQGKMPHLLISTGCITNADYKKDKRRLPTKAEYVAFHDHEISGIIVEIADDSTFFVKEVMFDVDGSFVEVNRKNGALRYFPNGKVEKEECLNLNIADSHVEESDPVAENAFLKIGQLLKPKTVSLHDVFSYQGPGHHTAGDKIVQAKMFENGWSLQKDIKLLGNFLEKWDKVAKDEVLVVCSNHDEHIEKAVKSFQLDQPATYRTFLEISLAIMRNEDPLEFSLREYTNTKLKKTRFLGKRDRYVLQNSYGEMALHFHGDIGADGNRRGGGTGKASLAVSVGTAIVGHTHSPRIISGGSFNGFGNGNVWVNGTSTHVDGEHMPEYTRGPSSWLNTSTAVFGRKDGRFLRTQMTVIRGQWSMD